MRLGRHTNGISCEYEMQEKFCKWLTKKEFKYKDEVRVKEVRRIADFLVLRKNKLINVEAKCNDFSKMLKQMDDHAEYCDYSFAFIPDYSATPEWFKHKLMQKKYGLIIYNYDTGCITEVLEAHHNKPKNKDLKKKVVEIILKHYEAHKND